MLQATPITDASIAHNSGWLHWNRIMLKTLTLYTRLNKMLPGHPCTCPGAFLFWLSWLSHPLHLDRRLAHHKAERRVCHCPPSSPHRSQGACSKLLRHHTLIARELNVLRSCHDIETVPFLLIYFYPAPSTRFSSSPPKTAAPRCLNKRWTSSSSPTTAPTTPSMCPAYHPPSSTPSTMCPTSSSSPSRR